MTTGHTDQTFPVPENSFPNSSGHFYHFIHPHGKKTEAASSWDIVPALYLNDLSWCYSLVFVTPVISSLLSSPAGRKQGTESRFKDVRPFVTVL